MSDLQWFPFYFKDFLLSRKVLRMSKAQKWAYVMLLGQQWIDPHCGLPGKVDELKELVQWTEGDGDFKLVRDCFTAHPLHPTMLHNARLYTEWQRAQGKRQSARASAQARWQKPPQVPAVVMQRIPVRKSDGFTPIKDTVAPIADKWFPPVP
jgi:hypothetical protein